MLYVVVVRAVADDVRRLASASRRNADSRSRSRTTCGLFVSATTRIIASATIKRNERVVRQSSPDRVTLTKPEDNLGKYELERVFVGVAPRSLIHHERRHAGGSKSGLDPERKKGRKKKTTVSNWSAERHVNESSRSTGSGGGVGPEHVHAIEKLTRRTESERDRRTFLLFVSSSSSSFSLEVGNIPGWETRTPLRNYREPPAGESRPEKEEEGERRIREETRNDDGALCCAAVDCHTISGP